MSAPFVWFDLTTDESDFYTGLFGWQIGPGMGDYRGFVTDGGQPWAGLAPAADGTAGRWVPYVVVEDLDAAAKRATELRGTVIRDRTTGPAGTSVLVADPGGAVIALFTPAAAG
jgi:predicted enzyme related to lactoylglutathione lyase